MEQLMNWVRQIVFFLIFMSVIYQFVPDKKYKSYLKLFASLVLILLTVSPLTELFDVGGRLDFNQDVFAYPREVEEFRLRAEQVQGQQYEDILENYRQTVKGQLREMAERFGLYVSGCDVELSEETERFGQVTMVRMTVSYRRLDRNPDDGGQMQDIEEVGEIEEVRIPPVKTESGISERDSGQSEADGGQPEEQSAGSKTESARSKAAGNQDTSKLTEQIAQLYQLGTEQITINLAE